MINNSRIYNVVNLILFLTLINFKLLIGQEKNAIFNHITVENGLSNSLVFEMTQDSAGFVWIATQDGLNKYDGYSFKIFRGGDSIKTVPDNWISCITTDKYGNVWYGTRTAGIGLIENNSNRFVDFKKQLYSEFGEGSLNIQNLFLTPDNKLLIGTWGAGLLIYNINDSTFQQFLHDENNNNSLSENKIYSVFQDSNGNIWAGSQRTGLNKLIMSTGQFVHFDFISKKPDFVSNNFVLTVVEDYKGDIWVGTFSDGLYKIVDGSSKTTENVIEQKLAGIKVSKIFEDRSKEIWICTNDDGIFRYLRDEDKFANYRNNPMNPKSLNRDKVWSVMEDKSGLLWFGTLTNGINIYDRRKNSFKWIINDVNDNNSIAGNYTKSIMKDKRGNLWLGTTDGISVLKSNGTTRHINEKSGLSINNCTYIDEDNKGIIWISTWGGGINKYNPATGKIEHLYNNPEDDNSLADNFLKRIVEYNNKMYFGTERGLSEYDPVTGNFINFHANDSDSTAISNQQITELFIDSKNIFWVGTQGGLNIFNSADGTFKKVFITDADSLPQYQRIREIFEDSKGNIWIGTLGGGFGRIPNENEKFKFYNEKDGLSNNTIYEILEDDNGFLWISTNKGINKFNPLTGEIKIFKATDGLPGDEFNGGAAFKDSDGLFYFGGVDGVTYFNPLLIIPDKKIPEIVITKITVNGIEYEPNSFYNNLIELNLPYDKNFINISFAAIDYSEPESNRFVYKLEGLNDNWIKPDKSNTAVFTDLDYGEYQFHVQGTNKEGVWNREGRKLSITISPAWWDTIYAKIFYVSFLLISIYGIFKFRIRQIHHRQKLLKNLVEVRTHDLQQSKSLLEEAVTSKDKLFSIIAHDLKNPFVALLGYSEMMINDIQSFSKDELKETSQSIYDAATSVYTLLQNLLNWAQLQLNKLEFVTTSIDIFRLIDEVFKIYQTTASMKSLTLINNIPPGTFVAGDENMIQTIFRNIISNSIKFTLEGGKIHAEANSINGMVEILIKDNGVGMDKTALNNLLNSNGVQSSTNGTFKEKGTGLGIMLSKEFITKNNGKFNVTSELGKGTTISITLPVSYN